MQRVYLVLENLDHLGNQDTDCRISSTICNHAISDQLSKKMVFQFIRGISRFF